MYVIINADDFGFSKGVNEAIIDLAKLSKITSTTVMVNMPYFREITNCLEIPGFGVGLHLNLTQGRPVSQPHLVSTLVDRDGKFYPQTVLIKRLFTGRVSFKHLMLEIDVQYSALEEIVGDRITHIDSHQWIHKNPIVALALIRWKRILRNDRRIAMRSPRTFYISNSGQLFFSKPSFSFVRKFVNIYKNLLHNWYAKYYVLPEGELLAFNEKKLTALKILMDESLKFDNYLLEVSCHPASSLEGMPETKLLAKRLIEYDCLLTGEWNSKLNLSNFKMVL